MVVLVESGTTDVSLDAVTLAELAGIGVTNLALVRDERTVGIVLEGWAFEPDVSAGTAVAVLGAAGGRVRALRPVAEMAVSAQQKGALRQ